MLSIKLLWLHVFSNNLATGTWLLGLSFMWFRQVQINVTANLISANKKQSKGIINITLQELQLWVGVININNLLLYDPPTLYILDL